MKLIKNLLASLSLLSFLAVPMLIPAMVSAQTTPTAPGATTAPNIQGKLCEGVELKFGATCPTDDTATDRVNSLIKNVIDIFSVVVGVVAVIMIIVGGLKYITSGGESGNVTGAKNTILYAVVGLIIVALAQVIVRFVLKKTSA